VRSSLRGYAEAVLEEADQVGEAGRVAEDLAAVNELVLSSPELFSALTDVGVPGPARRAVLDDLLSSRVRPGALRIALRAVVEERGPELPPTLGELAEQARVVAEMGLAVSQDLEPPLGRMATRHRTTGYAAAVLESVGRVDEIEEIEDQLFRLARIVEATPDLRAALTDAGRPVTERRGLLTTLLQGRVLEPTLRLARATVHPRVRDVVRELDTMVDEAARARGWRVARVRSARPIDDSERAQLAEALQSLTGGPVELQETADPTLLGGAVIEIGDLLVDASASHRLDQLEDHLLGAEGTMRGAMS
jgi:F0F1-type ATP synthase delta subunit